jgi:hypothetical protein
MKRNFQGKVLLCLVLTLLLILPAVANAQKQKIRVVVENASIRIRPDIQSDVIRKPPVGTVFDVEGKEGEWYEIRVRTEVGVLITGYIHEMFVEKVAEKKPEPEREVVRRPVQPVTRAAPQKVTRGEFVISGGYNMGYSISESLSYSDSFSGGVLQSATASGTLTQGLKKPLGFGAAVNYYFAKGFGIQLRVDINSKAKITNGLSDYSLTWSWTTRGPYTEEEAWDSTGDVSLTVLSGNFIFKPPTAGMIAPVISAGVSYFTGSLKVDTTGAYATTWTYGGYRYVDYFDIPAIIDASVSGIGFNIGGGADIKFSRNVALNIDARYFVKSKIEEPWELSAGQYESNINTDWTLTLEQEDIEELQEAIPLFEFNPSFFKISGGIKFMF